MSAPHFTCTCAECERYRDTRAELLAACKAALDWVRPHVGYSDERRETFERLERAITRAEGQS